MKDKPSRFAGLRDGDLMRQNQTRLPSGWWILPALFLGFAAAAFILVALQ